MREHLGGMTAIPQWFIWHLQWNPTEGKFDKRPWSVATNEVMDAQSSANWMSYDLCDEWVRYLRANNSTDTSQWAHGFMFTKGCGYWFFDADSAIDNGQYTGEIHNTLLTHMAGAAYEISSSGRGYHIFGRGSLIDHARKIPKSVRTQYPALRDLELYSEQRGVAFGLSGQFTGSADTDCSQFINTWLIPTIFPKVHDDLPGMVAANYADAPQDSRWIGPADDEDLLRRAMASASTSARFGNAATFAELWNNDPSIKARYAGESEIDQALIALLAFWTGKNPARMERLMLRSARKRDKWQERRNELTWLQHSIMEQVKLNMNVLIDHVEPAPADKPQVDQVTAVAEGTRKSEQGTFIDSSGLATYFAGCVYVTDVNCVFTPGANNTYSLLNQERFEAVMNAGRIFVTDVHNEFTTKKAWDACVKNNALSIPKVSTTCFRPDLPTAQIVDNPETGKRMVNTWVPARIVRKEGDPAWFLDLMTRLLPDERDRRILLSYMAAIVQNPGKKFRWCPVIQGTKGNGKSTVTDILSYAVGRQYTTMPTNKQLTGKFNDWQVDKLLARVEDGSVGEKAMEELRPMITEGWSNIEGKGVKISTSQTCLNFIFTMNALNGIHRDDDERRFAIFFTQQQTKEDIEIWFPMDYFVNLNDWLNNYDGYAICAHYLMTYPIDPEFNPVVTSRAPRTSSEDRVKMVNKSPLITVIEENISEEMPGTMGGWLSMSAVKRILEAARIYPAQHEVVKAIDSLGYRKIDSLGQYSRLQKNVMIDGNKKPVLYAASNHPVHTAQYTPAQIADWYSRDQSPFSVNGTILPQM